MCNTEDDTDSSGLSPKSSLQLPMLPSLKTKEHWEDDQLWAAGLQARYHYTARYNASGYAPQRERSAFEKSNYSAFLANARRGNGASCRSQANNESLAPSQANRSGGLANSVAGFHHNHPKLSVASTATSDRQEAPSILDQPLEMDALQQFTLPEPDLLDLEAPVHRFNYVAPNRRLDCIANAWSLPDQTNYPHLPLDQMPDRTGQLAHAIKRGAPPPGHTAKVNKWLRAVEPPRDLTMPPIIEQDDSSSEDEDGTDLRMDGSDASSGKERKDGNRHHEHCHGGTIPDAKPSTSAVTLASHFSSVASVPAVTALATTAPSDGEVKAAAASAEVEAGIQASAPASPAPDSNIVTTAAAAATAAVTRNSIPDGAETVAIASTSAPYITMDPKSPSSHDVTAAVAPISTGLASSPGPSPGTATSVDPPLTPTPMPVLTPTPAPQRKKLAAHDAAFQRLDPFARLSEPQGMDLIALE